MKKIFIALFCIKIGLVFYIDKMVETGAIDVYRGKDDTVLFRFFCFFLYGFLILMINSNFKKTNYVIFTILKRFSYSLLYVVGVSIFSYLIAIFFIENYVLYFHLISTVLISSICLYIYCFGRKTLKQIGVYSLFTRYFRELKK
jgi:hypothetical protein